MYNTPEFAKDFEFAGIRDLVAPGNRARLLLSHGMCSGTAEVQGADPGEEWVAKRLSRLASFVCAAPSTAPRKETFPGGVERYDVTLIGAERRTFDITFAVYGRPIDAARIILDEDSRRGGTEPRRAWANSIAKSTLMNDCLVDAVFYLGPNGDVIRRDVREFWCGYLGGKVTQSSGRLDEKLKCRINRISLGANAPVFLIPASLGSKVIFDAYRQVEVSGSVARAQALGPVGGIHLVTNQILLLDQAGVGDKETQILSRRATGTGTATIGPSLGSFISDISRDAFIR